MTICSLCKMSGETGWVEQPGLSVPGELLPPKPIMARCSDPDGVHRAAQVRRLAQISGLLPEELDLRLDDVLARGGDEGKVAGLSVAELAVRQDTTGMLQLACRFVADPWGFLTLWGPYGNAKTLILQAVVNEFREGQRGIGTYVRLKDLIDYIRAGNDPNAETDALDRYRQLKELPILAIDECDGPRMTDYAEEFRRAFLDDRYRLAVTRRAHTLFAMNTDPADLPGDIYDRLRDGRFVIYYNADSSLRPAMRRAGG